MKELLESIERKAKEKLEKATDTMDLENIRVELLGKKGALVEVLKGLKDLSIEEKKEFGMVANKLKSELEIKIAKRKEELENERLEKELSKTKKIDIIINLSFLCYNFCMLFFLRMFYVSRKLCKTI